MKLRYIACLLLGILFIYSCEDNGNTYTTVSPSQDAQIYSFKLAATHLKQGDSLDRAQDSLRFIEFNKTKFAIDQVNSIIYNPDSLPYGLKLDKAMMTLTFNSNYGASKLEIETVDSTFVWTTSDSVDVSKKINLIVSAQDASSTKKYTLDIRIHQIDPDVMYWEQVNVLPSSADAQRVLSTGSSFYAYLASSGVVSLYTSPVSGISWTAQPVSGLPAGGIVVENISTFGGKLFAITDGGDSYLSNDGMSWSQKTNGKNVKSILGTLPDSGSNTSSNDVLLVTYEEGGKYYFGTTTDFSEIRKVETILGQGVDIDKSIKSGFPIKGAAGVTNNSGDKWTKVLLLMGGVDSNGDELNSTWMISKTGDEYSLMLFNRTASFKGEGLSAFQYNGLIYTLASNQLYTSASWGEFWTEAPEKQSLDSDIAKRTKQSIIVDDKNYIWIFGGVSESNVVLDDIWRGRLNSLIVK